MISIKRKKYAQMTTLHGYGMAQGRVKHPIRVAKRKHYVKKERP